MTTAEYAYRGVARSANFISSLFLLSRPGILTLVLLSGFTGMVMAAKGIPGLEISTCALLCLLLSAAGSVMINSVLDYHLDLKMVRLRARVGAMNIVGRNRVMLIASSMIAVSLVTAAVCLNVLAASLIASAAVFYVGPYTLWLKRRSPFGVVPGGIPGAMPVLAGYAAVADTVRPEAFLLFLVVILWQPPHFWIYALKYRDDYVQSGVPALPAAVGETRSKIVILLYAAALLPAATAFGITAHMSLWYQGVSALLGVLFTLSCLLHVVKRPLFGLAFRASICYLFFLFLAIIADVTISGAPAVGG